MEPSKPPLEELVSSLDRVQQIKNGVVTALLRPANMGRQIQIGDIVKIFYTSQKEKYSVSLRITSIRVFGGGINEVIKVEQITGICPSRPNEHSFKEALQDFYDKHYPELRVDIFLTPFEVMHFEVL